MSKTIRVCLTVSAVAVTLYTCIALGIGTLRLIEHREPPACCARNADCPLGTVL